MTPEEIAMKLASASATCEGNKCPYRASCKGDRLSCKMNDVALMLRAESAEITKLRSELESLKQGAIALANYTTELERINKKYYKIIAAFQDGYRTRAKLREKVPRIGSAITKGNRGRKKKSLVEMDGDERYAMPEEPKPPKDPVVII